MKSVTSIFLLVGIIGSAEGFLPSVPSSSATRSYSTLAMTANTPSEYDGGEHSSISPMKKLTKSAQSLALAASLLVGSSVFPSDTPVVGVPPAHAVASKVVGSIKGSGLVFKDTLNIERFEDPKVKGVELYISNFDRPITEKLNGSFFNDPTTGSVACAKVGKVSIADNINTSPGGEEVFEESKSLLFKALRVQRIYDTETNTVVYVSFNTRLDKGDDANKSRFKSSLCAVNLNDL